MLKTDTKTPQEFFDLCLYETGLSDSPTLRAVSLRAIQPEPPFAGSAPPTFDNHERTRIIAALEGARDAADKQWMRGRPELTEAAAARGSVVTWQEWNKQWAVWSGARRPAFFARAALALVGDRAALEYLLDQIRANDNIVVQAAAFDALQHATGRYLDEAETVAELLERQRLADWWRRWLAEHAV